jgi:hypothetical protein
MVRRITAVSLGFIFLLALALNVYLLFSAVDGTRIGVGLLTLIFIGIQSLF